MKFLKQSVTLPIVNLDMLVDKKTEKSMKRHGHLLPNFNLAMSKTNNDTYN